MASRSSAVRKSPAKSKLAAKAGPKAKAAAKKAAPKVGKLPEWNLADLYTAIDAPETLAPGTSGAARQSPVTAALI